MASKPGLRAGPTAAEIETTVWVALDRGTYRTLTEQAGLGAAGHEAWLSRCYASMLLPDGARVPSGREPPEAGRELRACRGGA